MKRDDLESMEQTGVRNSNILEVNDLCVKFYQQIGVVHAVNGVDFSLQPGGSIGIVGESGCGKTITSYSLLRILPPTGKITSGTITFTKRSGEVADLTRVDPDGEEIRRIRGGEIAMIFQEPMSALSPVHTMSNQITEAILLHQSVTKDQARDRVVELLDLVGIPSPEQRANEYSFQLSGGMRQRAMIAMALACNPRVLIADEPTTALDVTIQAQVLKLIKTMQQQFNLSLLLITHDLGVIAHMVDYLYVMYLGQVMEAGSIVDVLVEPEHPYTRDLLKSIPRIKAVKEKMSSIRGTVPDAYNLPTGCLFHTRCSETSGNRCSLNAPGLRPVGVDHFVRCLSGVKAGNKPMETATW